mgnify:CR=1 FL=1
MAYTQAHLDALEAALVKGEKRVTFGDKTVEYRSVDELQAAIAAVNEWFPKHIHARGQALYSSLSFGGGGLFGGIISGLVWEPLGAGWAFTLGSIFALLGWFCIAKGMSAPAETPNSAPLVR